MEPSCCMCGGICTLRHILTGCPTALHQGRYTWRHNTILTVLQSALTQDQAKHSTTTHNLPYITFVKPGAKLPTSRQPHRSLLSSSLLVGTSDWTFLFDLGESLTIPPEIAITNLRPDAVIFSRHLITVIMLELMVPIEDRVSISENIETARYKNLISNMDVCLLVTWMFAVKSIRYITVVGTYTGALNLNVTDSSMVTSNTND